MSNMNIDGTMEAAACLNTCGMQNDYWYIDNTGECKHALAEDQDKQNDMHYIFENRYSSEEAAKDALCSWQILGELKRLAADKSGTGAKRDLTSHKWHLVYICHANKIIVTPLVNSRTTVLDVFFDTEEEAKNAIKTIGEQRLKKYFFNVCV